MNEQENAEPKKSKKIVIALVVIAVILGVYYFNKPNNTQQKSEEKNSTEQQQASNENEGSKEEVKSEEGAKEEVKATEGVTADSLIKSVEVKTTQDTKKDVEQKPANSKDALALVNSLVASSPVAVITLEPKQAAEKAINYVNKYVVPQGQEAKVAQVFPEKITFYRFLMDVAGQNYPAYVSIDGKKLLSAKEYDLDKNPNTIDGKEYVNIENDFQEVKGAEICKENGKPIVYFFGSSTCPHCDWEKPIISEVAKLFGSKISYHENIDNSKDLDVLNKFSPQGGIPTIVIGCKYFKVGSGETIGSAKEKQSLLLLINKVLQ
ncbi:MAG: thioredoxin family protein [Candidatus Pacebacteria bacterium]|nr:thioredoxin family protein [Candidatus Paceibacterota bacterium]